MLLLAGADPRMTSHIEWSPLMEHSANLRVDCVRELIPVSDVNHMDEENSTALHVFGMRVDGYDYDRIDYPERIVDMLVAAGIELDKQEDGNGDTALTSFLKLGRYKLALKLVKLGANTKLKNAGEEDALDLFLDNDLPPTKEAIELMSLLTGHSEKDIRLAATRLRTSLNGTLLSHLDAIKEQEAQ
jgi:hypothetical protein